MAKKSHTQPVAYDVSAGKRYAAIPKAITDCANYRKLTTDAKALLLDSASLFNGKNNGDISLAIKLMEPLGWNKRRLMRARRELEYYGFITIARQGGSHKPTLYALAWINIHHCCGKLEVPSTKAPACTYLEEKSKYVPPGRKPSIQPETMRILNTVEIPEWAA